LVNQFKITCFSGILSSFLLVPFLGCPIFPILL